MVLTTNKIDSAQRRMGSDNGVKVVTKSTSAELHVVLRLSIIEKRFPLGVIHGIFEMFILVESFGHDKK